MLQSSISISMKKSQASSFATVHFPITVIFSSPFTGKHIQSNLFLLLLLFSIIQSMLFFLRDMFLRGLLFGKGLSRAVAKQHSYTLPVCTVCC